MVCSGCGLDLCRVETPADPVAAAVARGRSLLAQADLGRDRPLEIWGDAEALAAVRREALSDGAEPAPSDPLFLTLPDQRQWRLCPLEGRCRAEAGPAVLLHPPTDVGRLLPLAPRHGDSELILLYDEADLRRLAGESSHEGVARLLAVLTDSAALAAEAPGHDQPGRPTLTSWGLAWLTALPEPEVRRQLGDLTWAARLGESFDAPIAGAHGEGRLRLHVSRRDLELQLGGLSAHMRAVVAASHGGIPAGVPAKVIWPDCQGSAGLLDRQLDRFLALAASPAWCAALGVAPAVIHEAPEGAWFSAVRRVGRLVEPEVLIAGLADTLDHVATWSDSLLAETSRVDTGIDVPLSLPATPRDRALLVLGQELGFWCLGMELGDDLVALAEVTELLAPAVTAADAPCRRLLLDQAAAADAWRRRLERTPPGGVLVSELERVPAEEPRRWWRRGSGDPLADLRREITSFADDPRHRFLVLDGPVGTGRVPALLSGLAGSRRGRRAEIWCPDHATMAWVQRTARRIDPTWSLDLRLGAVDQDVGVVANRAPAEQRPVVLVEAQRFPRQVCYKLQDAGREPGLIITVDPWEIGVDTSWEDLFITTPREADVRRLRTQLSQARLPWEVTRNLVADVQADARSFRRERGQVKVRRAGTIDECAAAVTVAHEADKLGPEVLVLAPHAEDVDLLGRALGDRLWAAGRADAVALLLAPGLLETVAALADAHRQQHGHWPGGPGSLAAAEPLLSELLPGGEARGWHTWLRSLPTAELETADAFLLRWRRSPWGRSQAPTQLAQDRVATWCEARGVEPMACLPREIWLCWRRILADALGRPDLAPPGPVALLATADAAPAGGAESLVYVCFGSEPATVHRRCLSQATDRALVLYQERSPLPGDHDETG